MKIEIWTDIVCPWCGLGEHRLKTALARFAHRDAVVVEHRAFQLDPSAPEGTTVPVRDMLRHKLRMDEERIRVTTGHIEALAAQDGLAPYHVGDNRTGNTLLAHQFAAHAATLGKDAEAWSALYRAHFGARRSVFEVDSLVTLGAEIGLEPEALRAALQDGRHRATVDAQIREARALGCGGVPFFVFDRTFAVSGAQSIDVFGQALQRAWDARPRPIPVLATPESSEGSCADGACAVPDPT
jgi:predicted DsbA family dithiol-disulfide isomerase